MIFAIGLTRTKSLIFLATDFSREDRKTVRESSSSTSVQLSPTRQRRPCGTPFEAGICLSAVTKLSKTCHGCSTRLSGAGSSITGGTIARHFIRPCVNWIEILPFGLSGNTRSCATICAERRTGSLVFRGALGSCSHIGGWGTAWLHVGSCMSREAHVQFCESLGVRFPGATHHQRELDADDSRFTSS